MQTDRPQPVDPTKILTRRELTCVLADLVRKAPRSANTRLNLVLVRLACCCGLRVSEIARLQIPDVRVEVSRPHLRIRRGAAKGGRPRIVPLWWDAGTLADLSDWKSERLGQPPERRFVSQAESGVVRPSHAIQAAAGIYRRTPAAEPFVACLRPGRQGTPLSRHTLRKRFRTACKVLGRERLEALTIHHGRHTFISHALAGGRTLAEVRDAAGHANVSITSTYLHVAVDDDTVGHLFRFP